MNNNLLRNIYYALNPNLRFIARKIWYFPIDLYEGATGKRDNMTPPKGDVYIGSGDFKQMGAHLLELFIETTGLKPNHKVLDIGCGIGRLAVALTNYLTPPMGKYEGFDIVKKGINWCNKHIHSKFPNFEFKHIDLKNDLYNLSTDQKASNFIFPYENKVFDRVILTSVFTHMMPEDTDNYLKQINRVMKDDGLCLATFFLLNKDIIKKIESEESHFSFKHNYGKYRLLSNQVKEANIAFQEDYLDELLKQNGLKMTNIYYGSWSRIKQERHLDFQDIVIISKL